MRGIYQSFHSPAKDRMMDHIRLGRTNRRRHGWGLRSLWLHRYLVRSIGLLAWYLRRWSGKYGAGIISNRHLEPLDGAYEGGLLDGVGQWGHRDWSSASTATGETKHTIA